jgi:predicted metalloprotease with PDZ domain
MVVDATFSGQDHDFKDSKELLGISLVVLASPKLSDETLKHVAEMPEIARLNVNAGAFTSAGLREFRKARPEVAFFASGPAVLGIRGVTTGPCRVDEIVPNAGAAKAGLASGDEIISVDGQAIETFADLTVEVYTHKPGEKINIVYLRDGKRNEATILLGQRLPGQ